MGRNFPKRFRVMHEAAHKNSPVALTVFTKVYWHTVVTETLTWRFSVYLKKCPFKPQAITSKFAKLLPYRFQKPLFLHHLVFHKWGKSWRAIRKYLVVCTDLVCLFTSLFLSTQKLELYWKAHFLCHATTIKRWLPDVSQPLQMTSLFSLVVIARCEGKPLVGWHECSSFQTTTNED